MLLSSLLKHIREEPALENLDVNIITQFIDLSRLLKTQISYVQPHYVTTPPARLPINIHEFLRISLEISDDITKRAWSALREVTWEADAAKPEYELAYLPMFLQYGLSRNICEYLLHISSKY